jgi:serine palmitoyltransferase
VFLVWVVLREAIIMGQPKTRRPWTKIMVMVEGIYSMEGIICNLKEVVRLCKKYRAYLYVDEAHSIGALGRTGRGVCEHCGVNPADVDILMGTFSKSFAGMGGYIAASKEIIEYLRATSAGLLYHNSLSPIVTAQVLTALRVISGEDGTKIGIAKIDSLRENSNYFRSEMERIGVSVVGDYDSPVVPVLIYQPAKIAAFSRECLLRGLAVVVVGFPATSVIMSRARYVFTREFL